MSDISNAKSASTSTFLTALVFNAFIFAVEIGLFTLLRPYFKAVYEPRTYAPPPSKRVRPLSSNLFLWPWAVYKADYSSIIKANGLDAYCFVRFLRMMVIVFLPIWLISWAVLLPVDYATVPSHGRDRLDRFSFGNLSPGNVNRFPAHLVLAWLFTGWLLYNIKREMSHFITTRHMHLIDPSQANSTQACTVLVTGVPARYLDQESLYHLFKDLPGGIKKIWINRDLKELPDIYDRRMAACAKLESAETALLRTAAELRLKDETSASTTALEAAAVVPADQRPTHRLGFFGLWGEKVDSIEWARKEIATCNQLLDEGRKIIDQEDKAHDVEEGAGSDAAGLMAKGKEVLLKSIRIVKGGGHQSRYPPLSSAFVTFHRQIAAHLAAQALLHHKPYAMSGKYTGLQPEDVIWTNLGMNPYERKVRMALSYAATAALIIFWAFPVAFVGVVSNIHTVCQKAPFLAWICKLKQPVVGIISGVLPPVLLAVLMMVLPIVLRLFAKFEGIPQKTGVELSLMSRFFIFQVVHSFLIVTLSSGIMATLTDILNNPNLAPQLLAQNLPLASNFFLTYIILQGLSGSAAGFLQIVSLVVYYVKLFLFGSTPRSVYGVKYGASSVAWGTLFPVTTLLTVIALGYSVISPIINGLAFATFCLFYMLYKYLFIWVYQQGTDTGGLFFPKAIQHVFVGLYVEQVCLAALFFLSRGANKHATSVPEGVLMVVLIGFTAFFHAIINNSYGPLEKALPLTLADKTEPNPVDVEAEAEAVAGPSSAVTDERDKDVDKDRDSGTDDRLALNKTGSLGAHDHDHNYDHGNESFAHPAVGERQRTIWLPRDALGMAGAEEKACREAGVDASVGPDATMDKKGKVDVTGFPPEMRE
ncbi:hypothetical protein APHAL10511_005693 [Amanita phalloides]|nr:hypothetical protein APHAL10511_005693 [Amanita phalloides]